MTSFVTFADSMGIDSSHIPADPKLFKIIALYATGTNGIEATAAEITRFTSAGVGVVLIDQTPSLSVFAAGIAHVAIADVEPGAGTPFAVTQGVKSREAKGIESVIYVDGAQLPAVQADLHQANINLSLVSFGLANWNLSLAEAENLIANDSGLAFVQWASPSSNPLTIVPGTGENLRAANVDLDVANATWAAQFMIAPQTFPVPPVGPFWHDLGSETIAAFAASRGGTDPLKMLARSVAAWSPTQQMEIVDKATNMTVLTVNP